MKNKPTIKTASKVIRTTVNPYKINKVKNIKKINNSKKGRVLG